MASSEMPLLSCFTRLHLGTTLAVQALLCGTVDDADMQQARNNDQDAGLVTKHDCSNKLTAQPCSLD